MSVIWDGEIQFVNKVVEQAKKLSALTGDLEYSCEVEVTIWCADVQVGVVKEEDGVFSYEQTAEAGPSATEPES